MSIQGNYMKGNTVIKITSEGLTELKPDKPEEPKEPQREEKVIPFASIQAWTMDPDPYKDALRRRRRRQKQIEEQSIPELIGMLVTVSLPVMLWTYSMIVLQNDRFYVTIGLIALAADVLEAYLKRRRRK